MTTFTPKPPLDSSRRAPVATIAAILFAAAALPCFNPVAAQQHRLADAPAPQGEKIFELNCSMCHGMDGRGGVHRPDIAAIRAVTRLPDAALIRIIEDGIPSAGMPPFRTLGPESIKEVAGYLRTLQGLHRARRMAGSPALGKRLFFGLARCSSCHMVREEGGFLGADLTDYALTHSRREIAREIVGPGMAPDSRAVRVVAVTRDGRNFIGIVRNEDNFTLQMQTSDGHFHLFMKSDLTSWRHLSRPWMPGDYSGLLSTRQIDDLASFLEQAAGQASTGAKKATVR